MPLPLLAIAEIVSAAGALAKGISPLLKKKPELKYKYEATTPDPVLTHIPGYIRQGPERTPYYTTPKNTGSKVLGVTGDVLGVAGTVMGGIAGMKGGKPTQGGKVAEGLSGTIPEVTTPVYKSTAPFDYVRQPGIMEGIQKNLDFGDKFKLPAISNILSNQKPVNDGTFPVSPNAFEMNINNPQYSTPGSEDDIVNDFSKNPYFNKSYSDIWRFINALKKSNFYNYK